MQSITTLIRHIDNCSVREFIAIYMLRANMGVSAPSLHKKSINSIMFVIYHSQIGI